MTAPTSSASSATLADAQREMRFAYYGGAPGVLVSAVAWLTAGLVAWRATPDRAFWTLFVGGMFIHPVSLLLTRALGRPARHRADNALGSLALATTFWMILMMPAAYAASRLRAEWFFPAMLLVIGGRYLTFSTLYGTRLYWVFGSTLALAGLALGWLRVPPATAALAGAAIELGFAAPLFAAARREPARSDPQAQP
jgi:hypothetical protein